MIGNLLKPEFVDMIHNRRFTQLREALCEFPAVDIAEEIFEALEPPDQAVLLRILPNELAADVFEYLPRESQESLLQALGTEDVAKILNEMEPDDRTAILEELPAQATQELLSLLTPEERKIATLLLGYPEESIGRRMTPEYVAIQETWTVAEVLEHLRMVGRQKESINMLYVTGRRGELVGTVSLRAVVTSEPSTPVDAMVAREVVKLSVLDDQETAVDTFKKYDRTVLPVVDSRDRLVGVVTVDDVLDVAEEEATEDIHKMGGMEALGAPYMETGLVALIKKRAGWLVLLFLGQLFTILVVGAFEESLARLSVLMLFLPLIISCGGNSGSQASTLIIRAMALRDVELSDWWQVLRRELASGIAFGLILALMACALVFGLPDYFGPEYAGIAVTVAFSLIGVVVFGCVIGAMLPFTLQMLKLDPAVCSAPLVTTLVDVSGLVIYFGIAQVLLRHVLG